VVVVLGDIAYHMNGFAGRARFRHRAVVRAARWLQRSKPSKIAGVRAMAT
jgi:hypothetical protein